jgi:(methylthio)acryloyl-CoA hydratase
LRRHSVLAGEAAPRGLTRIVVNDNISRKRAAGARRREETHVSSRPPQKRIALPESLTYEQAGEVAILRLNRAHKRNALDDETVLGIESFFSAVPDEARAVLLAGEGEHFSAGLDLTELQERDIREGIEHSRLWHRAFEKVQYGRVPVVAVLHGAVVGGGLELAAAAHVRVAERSAYYALPEGSRGIYVGGGGSVRLPRLIGVARMMDMMLTGRTYSSEEGLAMGLTTYLVEPGDGFAKGLELAKRIAGNTELTNFAIMQALPRIAEMAPQSGFAVEALMASIAQSDPQAKQRLNDFLQKRAPKVTRD